jgi:DNA-binding IclR family transcriptional regulator
MAAMQIQEAPAAMIDRVSTVLDAFIGQRPLTLVEVARRSNLPPSSTHRILQRLVELGWVE